MTTDSLIQKLIAKKYTPDQGIDAEMESYNSGIDDCIAIVRQHEATCKESLQVQRSESSVIDKALANATNILANFKPEGQRGKYEELEACYAMLFKQLVEVTSKSRPATAMSEIASEIKDAPSEISVVDQVAEGIYNDRHTSTWTELLATGKDLSKIQKYRNVANSAILAYERLQKPVIGSVSLEKCARALADGDHRDYLNRFDMASYRRYAENVLKAAGVKYYD